MKKEDFLEAFCDADDSYYPHVVINPKQITLDCLKDFMAQNSGIGDIAVNEFCKFLEWAL